MIALVGQIRRKIRDLNSALDGEIEYMESVINLWPSSTGVV